MRPSELAEFYRTLGYRVIKTQSCFWYSTGLFQFKSLPDHHSVAPSRVELARVMIEGPAVALRYTDRADHVRADGAQYVCSNRHYDLASLSPNSRSRTCRGLARCRVERIEFEYLAHHGYELAQDTHLRQIGKPLGMTPQRWERYWEKASQLSDFEVWGAFVEDRLAAFTVTVLVEECLEIYRGASNRELLKFYPNEALLFTVLKSSLSSSKVRCVSMGRQPLAASGGLDYFKKSIGFTPSPLKDRVVLNPLFRPILTPGTALVGHLARRNPQKLFWSRLSEAIRLNLKIPVEIDGEQVDAMSV